MKENIDSNFIINYNFDNVPINTYRKNYSKPKDIIYSPKVKLLFLYYCHNMNEDIFRTSPLHNAVNILNHKITVKTLNLYEKSMNDIINELKDINIILYKSHSKIDNLIRNISSNIDRTKYSISIIINNSNIEEYVKKDLTFYDVIFYESDYAKKILQNHNDYHKLNLHYAFGINIPHNIHTLIKPHSKREYNFATVGIFKKKKLHGIIFKQTGNRVSLGYNDDSIESKDIMKSIMDNNVKVVHFTNYDNFIKELCNIKTVVISNGHLGGGESVILEARLCGCNLKIINKNNLKIQEMLNKNIESQYDYSNYLLRGLSTVI